MPDAKIKIFIVEDHTVLREGLRALLGSQGGLEVIGEAAEGGEAVSEVCELKPDLVIMDLFLEGLSGIEAIERIKKKAPKTKILVLSMYGNEEYVTSAVRAGADGYLIKGSGISEIVEAISSLMKGGKHFSPSIAKKIDTARFAGKGGGKSPGGRLGRLTPREKEILQLIAEGRTSSQIADDLFISVKTVETHRTNLMTKLDIHNTAGLVRFAVSVGLVPPSTG
ncbi:MAG: response regulator transcription factor [Pseudomonadota bacterium]